MKTAEIIVSGTVQGVMFRNWVADKANLLGLKGEVQNQSDGKVQVIVQGEVDIINNLMGFLFEGSALATVESMNIRWIEVVKDYKDFKIIKKANFFIDQAHSMTNLAKQISRNVESKFSKTKESVAPKHVAIIPNGNRRWARSKGWHAWVGHRVGMKRERFMSFFDACTKEKIQYLSFWGFSTENWDRDKNEINFLWDIYRNSIAAWEKDLMEKNVRILHAGRKDHLPVDIIENLKKLEKVTKDNTGLTFVFCLDYGGRDEISRAINKAIRSKVKVFDIEKIHSFLDTRSIPDPDLIIRTGGEKRLSGFMAYQCAYSELYFTNTFFPDFDVKEFHLALEDYSNRIRRFGSDSVKDMVNVDVKTLYDPTIGEIKK